MSAGAAAHFWNQGYQNVRVVLGGLGALKKAGFIMVRQDTRPQHRQQYKK
ncbi:hypothetical protein NBG4_10069 [Candidatus Sulfobium mesophilum]|uniref:Rhodanese domain-containing protein n=1 Tax=Candidatus Sulfobium mesophilum TaxID=2016548 RepID=A0A2U3QDX2_9BACT|nr:hypothetical protein NBG4_10069 [Candidatus Sulfobium mesophilum]